MIVACAQYAVRDLDTETNLERSVRAIREAADTGADLVVLPELANSGCDFSSRKQALTLAEEVGETGENPGPTLRVWREA
ncbi:MAG: hydratase, partial [Actinomycetota bacterium]|nr:hydratase [Actinomycetota bacterium]